MRWMLMGAAGVLLSGMLHTAADAQESAARLGDVVVTATKSAKDPKDVTQSVSVVTGEQIRSSGATDVAEAIQNTLSVNIGDYGTPGSVQSLFIRGANSSQVLVLLNGIRMNSSRDGGFDLSFIPVAVEDIERIEIIRGSGSALYGSDAVGGVVNVITKKPLTDRSRLEASVGSHGYDSVYLGGDERKGALYFGASAKRETSDGYRENSDLYQWVFSGKAGYELSRSSSLEFSANYLQKEMGAPGPTFWLSPHARQMERNGVYSGVYSGKLWSTMDLRLSGYRKEDVLEYEDPDTFPPTNSRHESRTDGGELQLTWLLASWNQLTGGYELRRDTLESTDAGSHAASLKALYLQDEISIGDPLIVIIGGREDDHSVYGDKFSPKVSARYSFRSTGTIIRASYGKSFRAPTFNELYWSDPYGTKGNPDLRPESAKEYEIGIEQSLGKTAVLSLTGFDRKVTDLIDWQEYALYQFMPVNIGKADIRGYEVELAGSADMASWSVNYTYTNPVDEVSGQKVSYYTIPQKQLKGRIAVMLDARTQLSFEGRGVENYVKPGQPDWKYSVYDAKITQKIGRRSDPRGEIFFAMTNIFDRKYETVKGYPMPPKEISGGISYSF